MFIQYVKAINHIEKKWSGGITTELFISPLKSSYAERNFDFRISTATVEAEETVFTSLPTIKRTLMVLDGKMTLEHENQHQSNLGKFDIDRFDGEWKTKSIGKCSDFNLMTRGNTDGDMVGKFIEKGEFIEQTSAKETKLFIYGIAGKMTVHVNEIEYFIEKGDLLTFETEVETHLTIFGNVDSEFVEVVVFDRRIH